MSVSRTSNPSNSRKWLARMAGAGLIASTVAFGLAGTANADAPPPPSYPGYLGSEYTQHQDWNTAWTKCRSDPRWGSKVHSVKPADSSGYAYCSSHT
jgi:hypothetical protein